MSVAPQPTAAGITARHYQAICGLALSAVILIQMQGTSLLPGVALVVSMLIGVIGVLGILYRARLSPLYVLAAIAAESVVDYWFYANRAFQGDGRMRTFDLADMLLCAAALTYFIGHYRLQGLWFGVLPPDARLTLPPSPAGRGVGGEGARSEAAPSPPQVRSEQSLSAAELIALILTVPSLVLLAEIACLLLKQPWGVVQASPAWKQVLLAAWMLLLGMFLAAHAFRFWRRAQMDRVSALLLLQDVLWNETRGEQRRINRWVAWKKLKDRK